jgi:hypothetical protein
MAVSTPTKISTANSNFNSPRFNAENNSAESQAELGLAVARPNLIRGGLVHISQPVRKILARLSTRMRGDGA